MRFTRVFVNLNLALLLCQGVQQASAAQHVRIVEELTVAFKSKTGEPLLSGLEVVAEGD